MPDVLQVYGSRISYFTGKLETYLRYRGLAYELHPLGHHRRTLIEKTGVSQMPVVQLADGRWMTDTTPMIAWWETQQPAPSLYPEDPPLRFVALLIEDYADEWLWRSAMHYRWSYRADRLYAAEALYDEQVAGNLPLPRSVGVRYLKVRQRGGFVLGDGVIGRARDHADETYLAILERLQAILETRPFLLGASPTIADFGMMGPMFRHFSQDPTPSEIMRTHAPAVYEWVARMWNAAPGDGVALLDEVDASLRPLLTEIGETHLAQLRQNAEAYTRGDRRYDLTIQGCRYPKVPTSRYRVWCLEELRRGWLELDDAARSSLADHLMSPEASLLWEPVEHGGSGYDRDRRAPFNRALKVFEARTPWWW